ncbi:ribosomal RNA processing protein 1 homolog B isoform X1 [Protobothrops mucrosquamatus]|uniref:ribosomal RNA processing protein 1 homolog B isoform X1 n=1 Tax=Protobothrops mucrosquamatus TaxID=103944 RepID=UPI000775F4FE|nr:ribosomal RNA processing protein 1 homolog B isoform X1 [Protobothrops mucrosquamatus]
MAPAALVSAGQPPEIQFAQRLASNEKRIRDRALKKLRGYITLRTQSLEGCFSQEELLKIWKGLFYCMWMQDKPLLQEELSNNISQLIHLIENMDTRHLFIQTFWQTVNREWNGLDRLRLDKFYMLIRMMLRQSFEVLKRNEWNESLIERFLNVLMMEVMHPDSHAPIGIKLHFIDIYLEELAKVGAKELTADQNIKFIEPFCKILARTKDHLMLQAIICGIFETIVDQSPFAIEDLMKELETGSDVDSSSEHEKWSDKEDIEMDRGRGLSNQLSPNSEAHGNISEDIDANIGPVLQFDYAAIANTIFELSSRKNTPAFNRKRLYKLVKKFQDLAEGSFPQDDFPEDVSTDEDDDSFSRRKLKRKSGKPLDKAQLGKKDNNQTQKNDSEEEEANTGLPKKKKRKRKSSQTAGTFVSSRNNENRPVRVESKTPDPANKSSDISKRQKSSSTESNEVASVIPIEGLGDDSSLKSLTCLVNGIKKPSPHKNGSLTKVPIKIVCQNGQNYDSEEDPSYCTTGGHTGKIMKRQQKSKPGITGKLFSEESVNLPEKKCLVESVPIVLQKVKLKRKKMFGNLGRITCSKQKAVSLKIQRKVKKDPNSTERNELENKKRKNEETGGIALPIKKTKAKVENDFVKFKKTALPKPAFFRKSKRSITAMPLSKLQSSSSKKVTFGLNKNMTAEFKKTDKSILVSPEGGSRVAFNPKQKPPHGVLKSSSGSLMETPQIKKSLIIPAKKRPTAMDFF